METFADYLLGEQDLINKMDILNKLQRMLREKRGISIFFNNTVIFKAEIARMFLEYTDVGKEVDSNLVLTACLLCNCKKIDGPQSLESLHSYAKKGAEFGGSDDAGSVMVEEIKGEAYEPWFTPVIESLTGSELPGEIESLIFCVQTGIGVGVIAFLMGRFYERKKWEDKEEEKK